MGNSTLFFALNKLFACGNLKDSNKQLYDRYNKIEFDLINLSDS